MLGFYTHRGFRVIACATKHIPQLDWHAVQKTKRADAESDLEFVGFIIFENKMKAATPEIVNELNEAGIRQVMCTGDNILTAISVARECSLIDRTAHCFVPYFNEGRVSPRLASYSDPAEYHIGDNEDPKARLIWQSVDNPLYELDEHTLMVRTSCNP